MRVPVHRQTRSAADNETMTPMIDVVFLLLVFFVCASIGHSPDKLLPASLGQGMTENPTVVADEPDVVFEHQQVRIRVIRETESKALQILLNENPVTDHQQLESRLQSLVRLDPKSPVIIDVADDVEVQQFITVYDLCQRLRFESINLAARSNTKTARPESVR